MIRASLGTFVLASSMLLPTCSKERQTRNELSVQGLGTWQTEDAKSLNLFIDEDRIVVVNFMFASCQRICPMETARLRKLYQELRSDLGTHIQFYSVSIDPEQDTVDQLRSYKQKFAITEGWHFLRGDQKSLERLQNYLQKQRLLGPLSLQTFTHGQTVWIGKPQDGVWLARSSRESSADLARLIRRL